MRKLSCMFATAVMTLTVLSVGSSAGAASTVDIDFVVSMGIASPPGLEYERCELTVPAGADGERVLGEAVEQDCIDSHEGSKDPQFGYFVECVDGICGDTVTGFGLTYWAFFVDGEMADSGVSAYEASDGDEFQLSYQTWAHCAPEWFAGIPTCDPRP